MLYVLFCHREGRMVELVDYHGIKLIKKEVDLLIDLENYLNRQIPQIDVIEGFEPIGFIVKNNHITGLAVYNVNNSFLNRILEITDLNELHLLYSKVKQIPEEICSLSKLRKLVLHYDNQFSCLPKSIGKLHNLEELSIVDGQLSSIPDEISSLSNLRILNLERNKISFLPEAICKLENLIELNIKSNEVESIPACIGNLSKLTKLDLGKNKILSLPSTMYELAQLNYLNVYGTGIDRNKPRIFLPKIVRDYYEYLESKGGKVIATESMISNLQLLIYLTILCFLLVLILTGLFG